MQDCTEQSTSSKLAECRPQHARDLWEACPQNQNVISMHRSVQTCSQLIPANSDKTHHHSSRNSNLISSSLPPATSTSAPILGWLDRHRQPLLKLRYPCTLHSAAWRVQAFEARCPAPTPWAVWAEPCCWVVPQSTELPTACSTWRVVTVLLSSTGFQGSRTRCVPAKSCIEHILHLHQGSRRGAAYFPWERRDAGLRSMRAQQLITASFSGFVLDSAINLHVRRGRHAIIDQCGGDTGA